jgi:hypothetical protein
MSNLHKDLPNDQIHEPKDFAGAANSTKLTKNASGNLEWVADTGGGGLVTSLTTTGTSGASTLSGTGVLNIPIYSPDTNTVELSQNIEGYGSIATGTEWGLSNAQYNSEHKFTVNLGSPAITTITPKNMVSTSVWVSPQDDYNLRSWVGWIFGTGGTIQLSLLHVHFQCPVPSEEYPATLNVCRKATTTLALTGNTTPLCWNINEFLTCEGFTSTIQTNDVLLITAYVLEGEECNFNLNCNYLLNKVITP